MIDMQAEIRARVKSITGRFQRNADGTFVGFIDVVDLADCHFPCRLVFDEHHKHVKDPAFLMLVLDE
jgi:hypothetical protein